MSKVAHYLQEHLVGEVMTSTDARRYFATDGSILQQAPALVAYPRAENDVRKTCRFTWQLAERGRIIPVTARGAGTDQAGAAIGSGIMLVFPAHMNRILELDTKSDTVTVEPGINFGKLQQTLHTHGRFLPPYPASLEYSTIGGAVANNASGEKSVKYGDMRGYVQSLRVVLANGEVIETGKLNKREFSKKLGLATFEGEIYRSLDTLLEEQQKTIHEMSRAVTKNNAGYALDLVRGKDGSFDLTPLFVGSQGTLGVVSEVTLATEPYNPQTTLITARFDSLEKLQNAVLDLRQLPEMPSALEIVDGHTLQQVHELNPNQLKDLIDRPYPAALLFIEFDSGDRQLKKLLKQTEAILTDFSIGYDTTIDPEQQQNLWKLRYSSGMLMSHNEKTARAIPLIDDGSVPVENLRAFMDGLYKILEANNLDTALWGRAGDASLQVRPRFDLSQIGDRQKAFKVLDEYSRLVLSLGGTISTETGDGRLRAPYLEAQYGAAGYNLLKKVKTIFDPYGTLNPGVKFGTSLDDIKSSVRSDFSFDHLYDHFPRR